MLDARQGEATRPREGDVVLRKESDAAGPRYSLWQVPGAPQLSCSSRDRALTCATAFARKHRVDIWEQHQQTFTRLAARESGR